MMGKAYLRLCWWQTSWWRNLTLAFILRGGKVHVVNFCLAQGLFHFGDGLHLRIFVGFY